MKAMELGPRPPGRETRPEAEPARWLRGPETVALRDGEVHVWIARLGAARARLASLWESLDVHERARAGRFRFRRDQEAYAICRGFLRQILGALLETPPGRLRFSYGPHGKPALAGNGPVRFNVSRSAGLGLIALTRGRELGVDLERIRPGISREAIAERFFSPREVASLRMLAPEERDAAFFACWTRKEAYVKARGEGLSLPLDRFSVSLHPGEPAALLEAPPRELLRWSMRDVCPGAGWAGALAAEGSDWRLVPWSGTPGEA